MNFFDQIVHSIKTFNQEFISIDEQVNEILLQLPNIPNDLVKPGSSEEDNEIVDTWGEMPELCEGAVEHWELTSKYDIIDFELSDVIKGKHIKCKFAYGKEKSFKRFQQTAKQAQRETASYWKKIETWNENAGTARKSDFLRFLGLDT